MAGLTVQHALGAVAPRLSAVKWRNLVLFKGQAGSSTSSPSQGCCHTEILGMRRSPLPELQITAGTGSSHPRAPASAPATTSGKEPACKTQSGQPKWLEQPGRGQQEQAGSCLRSLPGKAPLSQGSPGRPGAQLWLLTRGCGNPLPLCFALFLMGARCWHCPSPGQCQ